MANRDRTYSKGNAILQGSCGSYKANGTDTNAIGMLGTLSELR